MGIVVTDTWKAYKWHLADGHRHKNMDFMEFVRLLVHDLQNNDLPENTDHSDNAALTLAFCHTKRMLQ